MPWPIAIQLALIFIVVPIAVLVIQYWYLPRRAERLRLEDLELAEAQAFWASARASQARTPSRKESGYGN